MSFRNILKMSCDNQKMFWCLYYYKDTLNVFLFKNSFHHKLLRIMYVSGKICLSIMYFIKFAFNLIKEFLNCLIITFVIISVAIHIIPTIIISTKINVRNPLMKATEITSL